MRYFFNLIIVRIPPEAAQKPPTVLVKWYDWLRWLLDRVDSFPKKLVAGTAVAKPLILAIGNWNQIMRGMIYGGIPLATAGLL